MRGERNGAAAGEPAGSRGSEGDSAGGGRADAESGGPPRAGHPLPRDAAGLRREIVRLAWPAAIQNLLLSAMFIVDTKMVGALTPTEGPGPLAGVGIASAVMWTIVSIFAVLQVGAAAIVARATGAGDAERARQATATALLAGVAVGIAIAIAGVLLAPGIVLVVSGREVAEATRWIATRYFAILLAFFPVTNAGIVLASILRAAGDSRTPMWSSGIANGVNIVVNWLFIFGHLGLPRLGAVGAAVGTASAQVVNLLILAVAVYGGRCARLPVRASDLVRMPRRRVLGELVRVSVPTGLEQVLFHSAFLVFQGTIFRLGDVAVAAHRVAITVESLCFMPAFGFYVAASTLTGQFLGARDSDGAERALRQIVRWAFWGMVAVGALFILFRRPLAEIFVESELVVARAAGCLVFGGIESPLIAVALAWMGGLRGAGATKGPMVATAMGAWAARAPLGFVFAIGCGWGVVGAWGATVADWLIRSLILWAWARRGSWKRVRL